MHLFRTSFQRNLVIALAYQVLPALLCFFRHWQKPEANAWSYVAIFLIAKLLLALVIWNRIQKVDADVLDERELLIRLRVKSLISNVVEVSLVITTLVYFFVSREMSSLAVLMMIGVPALMAEAYGNWAYRKT